MDPSLYERIFSLQKAHWWYRSREKFLDSLLRQLPRGELVLDAGCGPGSMLHYFGKFGRVVGLDRYAPALTMARSHFPGALLRGDLQSLPFADSSFSLVAVCEVLYHRNIPDVAAAVRELVRVLKPGGAFLIVDSAYAACYSGHDLTAHGVRRFTRRELMIVMEAAGLEIVHATYAYALLLPFVWLLRRCKLLFGVMHRSGGELCATWGPLNSLVIRWFALESVVAGRFGLPGGLSIQLLGRKPDLPVAAGKPS